MQNVYSMLLDRLQSAAGLTDSVLDWLVEQGLTSHSTQFTLSVQVAAVCHSGYYHYGNSLRGKIAMQQNAN